MVMDVFLLHILETLYGYKIYDYFTYCDYRFRNRGKMWITGKALDRSISHNWRSLDSLAFSSQYYYIISLTTWGILFLYLGMTAMIRNLYNPFADPLMGLHIFMVFMMERPTKSILKNLMKFTHLWEID